MTSDDVPTYYFLHASWRTHQSLADLKALCKLHWPNTIGTFSNSHAAIDMMLNHTDCASPTNLTEEIVLEVVELIGDEQAENATRVCALAIFLVYSLHCVILKHDQDIVRCRLIWLYHNEWFQKLPNITRATLMNGFRENDNFYDSDDMWDIWHAPVENFQSRNFRDVSYPLIKIAQSSSDSLLRSIALADYGYRPKEHYKSLHKVIFELDCQMTQEHIIFPHEVVSLTSYGPTNAGFREMTALMLVAEAKYTHVDVMEFNWMQRSKVYMGMHESNRVPILDGFRFLYETDLGWEPSPLEDNQDYPQLLPPPMFEDDIENTPHHLKQT